MKKPKKVNLHILIQSFFNMILLHLPDILKHFIFPINIYKDNSSANDYVVKNINNNDLFNKKKISDLFIQDIKEIVNPYFCFVNLNTNSNYLVIHEDIEEDLVKTLLESANEHYVKLYFIFNYFNRNLF